jgi:hypothetical protein
MGPGARLNAAPAKRGSIGQVDFLLSVAYRVSKKGRTEETPMPETLEARIIKKAKNRIRIEITRENFEAFCDAIGLYRKEFLKELEASERDHRAGRVTKRKSLHELIE